MNKLYQFTAFGLVWQFPFPCPEMGRPLSQPVTAVDVTVRFGEVPSSLTGAVGAGPFQQVTPDTALFYFPGVAHYLIQCGNQITIAPEKNAPENQIRLFLLGTAASLLLHQRGVLPLHASGIRTAKGAVLFAGHSGSGKSTLLATFLERGYTMLTDDIAVITLDEQQCPQVFPGYPRLKLWADSAATLNKSTDNLERVRPEFDKFSVIADSSLETEPLPLHAVYVLTPTNEADLRLEALQDARKFNIFLDHTWQKLALKKMNRHVQHFQQAVAIANRIQVRRVFRPEQPFLPHQLADLIEEDFLA